jgi:hypothetical protein
VWTDDFTFWQSTEHGLTGYKTQAAIERDSGAQLVMLSGKLAPTGKADGSGFCNAAGDIVIQRVEAECKGSGPCATVRPQEGGSPLTLLNLLHAPKGSKLSRLAAIFTRIESIGYILAWTKSEDTESVDLVELPRLRLSFSVSVIDGKQKYFCKELAGLFMPCEACRYTKAFMMSLPCALLLANSMKEYYIVMNAAAKPLRPNQRENFPSALLFDRADRTWLSHLSVPYYVYQVHVSRRFLVMPSLASMLYLLLLRLHAREYGDIFKFVYSCVSDVELSREERQVIK